MKTLLLALAVVAFVCLGSANQQGRGRKPPLDLHSRYCFQCTPENHSYKCPTAEKCPGMRTKCYTLYKRDENGEEKWAVKDCAYTCPTAGPDERVKCCFHNRCNQY
uniref:Three-finger toxin 4c n=1 Tax=Philothamnus irregularis TaxID=1899461 RepID=A0A0B8RZX3_9SAUR